MIQRNTRLVRRTPPRRKRRAPSGSQPFYVQPEYHWYCEECGHPILLDSVWRIHAAQAHILPKELFPSVMNHPANKLHLDLQHHADWDSSWEKAATMKVFRIARERFEMFKFDITETTKIPDCFL